MIKYLYLLCLATLVGCTSNPSSNSSLGVIDLSGDYPTRKVDLKEIADVEYVPLETTDNSLLTSMCSTNHISDNYIITYDMSSGDIFLFTRSGRLLRKINKKGDGPGEYVSLGGLAVDFEAEELFIRDFPSKKCHIFSFEGAYKRSFPWMIRGLSSWYNLNKDYLIGYHDGYSYKTQRFTDTHPFYLMDKKDGKLTPLNLTVPNGISSTLKSVIVKLGPGESYISSPSLPIYSLLKNGGETLIADFSLDTLYSFKESILTPIAVKTPSACSTTPPTVIAPELYTDSFLFFRVISMYYDESDHFKPYDEAVKLIWNRKTNQVEDWEIYNSDIDAPTVRLPLARDDDFSNRNMGVMFYSAENLINLYKEGKLKGKLKEVASKLDGEDNHVLVIAKYK